MTFTFYRIMKNKVTLALLSLTCLLSGCGNNTSSPRYSVAIQDAKENGGSGFIITDNKESKTYLYMGNMVDGKIVIELSGTIDLSKAGEQTIEMKKN